MGRVPHLLVTCFISLYLAWFWNYFRKSLCPEPLLSLVISLMALTGVRCGLSTGGVVTVLPKQKFLMHLSTVHSSSTGDR